MYCMCNNKKILSVMCSNFDGRYLLHPPSTSSADPKEEGQEGDGEPRVQVVEPGEDVLRLVSSLLAALPAPAAEETAAAAAVGEGEEEVAGGGAASETTEAVAAAAVRGGARGDATIIEL